MTVSDIPNKSVYDADGSGSTGTRVWGYSFDIEEATDIHIYITSALGVVTEVTTNYDVDTTEKEVTYPTVASGLDPVAAGNKITIIREQAMNQLVDFVVQGAFSPVNIMQALDSLALKIQQVKEITDRCTKNTVDQDDPPAEA